MINECKRTFLSLFLTLTLQHPSYLYHILSQSMEKERLPDTHLDDVKMLALYRSCHLFLLAQVFQLPQVYENN